MMLRPRPDAIRSPLCFAGVGGAHARLAKLQSEFAPILSVPRVFVRHQGTEHFITADPRDSLYFQALSPRSGEPRYDWEERGDGVSYGYLKPDA